MHGLKNAILVIFQKLEVAAGLSVIQIQIQAVCIDGLLK